MRKIKYQGGLTKLIALQRAKRNKHRFAQWTDKNLPTLCRQLGQMPVDIDVVSFSSAKDFYDQVLSVLSFLRYVGTPLSWTLYSDGSHTPRQIEVFENAFEFGKVEVNVWEHRDRLPAGSKLSLLPYEKELLYYAKEVPLGKRLYYYLNHEIKNPTLFLDADILFYGKASVFETILNEEAAGWYLPDAEWGCLDSRYKAQTARQSYQVNGGFFLLNKELQDLEAGLTFLRSLNFTYEYFSDQNVFHILFRQNGFMPLDPRIFILNSDDQFDFSYLCSREKMAIRHYTGPVRHKMWQRNWKWHLSLT